MSARRPTFVGALSCAVATVSIVGAVADQVKNPTEGTFYERFGKRACDIAISLVALPVVGVATAVCGAAIKAEDGGPVFYNAPRVGRGGGEFTMFKLRSMKEDAPDLVMEDGSTYNGADDPRMTRVGAFMRKTSLDELPQFLNVLKGDMSVVGPRPDLAREAELYEGDEVRKLSVRPGITGYAAVYGRNSLPWHERLALDVYYVDRVSLGMDAKVFAKTFSTVFGQEGVYVDGEACADGLSEGCNR
ncbi:MAG: sugar transferase [Eggerthellaceae bacterium]|nr:sugar transferase [Eggerthellaceae bacterium]